MKHRARYEPEVLLTKYRAIRKSISSKEFFRSPKHQKTMEMWCAAHFARAYSRYVRPCAVLIDDVDIQTDVDFELELDGVCHPFQVTEVMEPGRRRGDEYRNGDPVGARGDDIESGAAHGASWIRVGLENKLSRGYAGVSKLNLLVYLNFAGRNQEYVRLRAVCGEVAKQFGSVWLLNGNTVCCIHPNPDIPSWEGWMIIDESLSNVDA
jgi:hypothetical protein